MFGSLENNTCLFMKALVSQWLNFCTVSNTTPMNTAFYPHPLPLSASDPALEVAQAKPQAKPKATKTMTTLIVLYFLFFGSGATSCVSILLNWTPQDVTSLIAALGGLFAAIIAGIIAYINAKTKAKIEEHRALSELNSLKLDAVSKELSKNTAITKDTNESVKSSQE
jgi:uncharacterized membrane protein YbhN (UPF0104 family)